MVGATLVVARGLGPVVALEPCGLALLLIPGRRSLALTAVSENVAYLPHP